MIDQIIPSLVSLIIGSVLTMGVTYFSLTITRKGEKDKIVREKLEEAYILLGELRYWLRVQRYQIHLYAPKKLNDIYEKEFKSFFWLMGNLNILDIDNIKCDCPIERIVMLVSLYAPTLRNAILNYEKSIDFILTYDPKFLKMEQEIVEQANEDFSEAKQQEAFTKILKLFKMEQEIMKQENEAYSVENKQELIISVLYAALNGCGQLHQELQSSLEKIITKV